MHRIALFLLLLATWILAHATQVFQQPKNFLQQTFPKGVPEPEVVWIIGDIKKDVTKIMGHDLDQLRVRYWMKHGRSAWILEEIGKEKPITTGIVVNKGKIEQIEVLIYRESRGWEVHYGFFTNQFKGAELGADSQLDRPIDNISGATLSVNALTKLARLALYLSNHVAP